MRWKKKNNKTIKNDTAWSDFDKGTVNKIETTQANESLIETAQFA